MFRVFRVRSGLLAVALAATVAACGGDSGSTGTVDTEPAAETTTSTADEPEATGPLAGAGQTVDVVALDNSFRPETIEVLAGTEVRFVNSGRNDHDVIPADQRATDELAWGVVADDFAPRDEYRVVFAEPGTYPYYCSIHGIQTVGMIGTIVVTG